MDKSLSEEPQTLQGGTRRDNHQEGCRANVGALAAVRCCIAYSADEMANGIPSVNLLITYVLEQRAHKDSYLHGEQHWKCVAFAGLELAKEVLQADRLLVFLFGLLHDARRFDDGHDAQHGLRAAALAEQLNGPLFNLDAAALKTLYYACEHHTSGRVSDDPTIGVCWDADRLNLWRIGVQPDPKYLSTSPGKAKERILAARDLHGQKLEWPEIDARIART